MRLRGRITVEPCLNPVYVENIKLKDVKRLYLKTDSNVKLC